MIHTYNMYRCAFESDEIHGDEVRRRVLPCLEKNLWDPACLPPAAFEISHTHAQAQGDASRASSPFLIAARRE